MNDSKLINKNMCRTGRNGMPCNMRYSGDSMKMSAVNVNDYRECKDCRKENLTHSEHIKMDKRKCMQNIYEIGFVITESILYLDTHPEDSEAIDYYIDMKEKFLKLVDYYTENFGPLNYYSMNNRNYWTWVTTPMPWEMED